MKRKEKMKFMDMYKELKKFVKSSFQVPAVGEIKAMIKRGVAELQHQKTIIEYKKV